MRHVGLEPKRLWAVNQLKQFDHSLPAVHSAPTDFALGSQSLAVTLGHRADLAKCIGNTLRIICRILGPLRRACRRIDADYAVRPDPEFAQLTSNAAGFADLIHKSLPLFAISHCRPAACRAPNGRNYRADNQRLRCD